MARSLGIPKGPAIGALLEEQLLWQISHRHSLESLSEEERRTQCLQHLREIHSSSSNQSSR